MTSDWTQPPLSPTPGDLRAVLSHARLEAVTSNRWERDVRLRFRLPPDAGPQETILTFTGATHLLTFAYLPPAAPLGEELSPEETMAQVGDWARQGLIVAADPLSFGTSLVVERASLHRGEGWATLAVEGYGEDTNRLVWWEVRVSGKEVEAG